MEMELRFLEDAHVVFFFLFILFFFFLAFTGIIIMFHRFNFEFGGKYLKANSMRFLESAVFDR